jgi:capsule polysaccharide export protein KpsE/RkpR
VSASSSQVGIITLKVRDRDPRMAMDIARHHIAGLDSINKKLLYERAEGTVEFTRKQIEMYRRRLEESRIRIAEFQEEHGVFNFDEQIRGAVDVASALEIRAAITAVQIDIMREFSRDEAIELHKKEIELRNINRQIENFMRGDTSRTVFLSLEKVPSLQQKYAALQRDLEVNERVYSFLLQRHEESGIDLARTTASVQVVDSPKIPEKRAGIPRWAVVLIAFAVGGAWMTLVLLWWGWTSMKERTGEEDEAFRSVIDQLSGDMAELRRRLRI